VFDRQAGGFHSDVVEYHRRQDHSGQPHQPFAQHQGQECEPKRVADAVADDFAVEEVFQFMNDHEV